MPIKPLIALLCLSALAWTHPAWAAPADQPNIIYILADDLGYGDVQCLNPDGKILTPNMDRIAAEGMTFTDAHSSSAVCTPTRYGILTGRYNWRRLPNGVLGGFSRPLIPTNRMTVASMLKEQGYATAMIGKWHLGMNWPLKAGGTANEGDFAGGYKQAWDVDYDQPIQGGPTAVGFDTYFGISASLDMPPYVFIRNDRVETKPTVDREFWPNRKGPASEDFLPVNVLPRLTEETVNFIDAHAQAAKTGKPFFIYMPLNSPHTPIVPDENWKGKSGINEYADFVMQTDWTIGQVLKALDRHGLTENTLIIVTSDNGCSPQANYKQLAEFGHDPSDRFRGHKADIFEGGHRIPFLVRWPAIVKPGSTSDQIICLTDLMATCADALEIQLPENAGEDSVSLMPIFTGHATAPIREAVVHHSINGSFSIRQGKWKLVLCRDSGGWSDPRPGKAPADAPPIQLFDLEQDIEETTNVQAQHPDIVSHLTKLLETYANNGRSTPGTPQKNDIKINLYK